MDRAQRASGLLDCPVSLRDIRLGLVVDVLHGGEGALELPQQGGLVFGPDALRSAV